jgi:hypothetical protein
VGVLDRQAADPVGPGGGDGVGECGGERRLGEAEAAVDADGPGVTTGSTSPAMRPVSSCRQ